MLSRLVLSPLVLSRLVLPSDHSLLLALLLLPLLAPLVLSLLLLSDCGLLRVSLQAAAMEKEIAAASERLTACTPVNQMDVAAVEMNDLKAENEAMRSLLAELQVQRPSSLLCTHSLILSVSRNAFVNVS